MATTSAAICLWRRPAPGRELEVLLVHPGGPFWASRDEHAWSLPKGEYDPATESGLEAAKREFEEELGHPAPAGDYVALGEIRQKSGKVVHAWAVEGDLDAGTIVSNTFEMEWPPRSGRRQSFPEVDRAEWSTIEQAAFRINPAQFAFIRAAAAFA